jgi:ATP-binding cassette subfamily B protein
MMVVTSPKLSGLVIAAIPLIVLPLVAFGRSVRKKSRAAQDTLAEATAYASEQIGAVRTCRPSPTSEAGHRPFRKGGRERLQAARASTGARAPS